MGGWCESLVLCAGGSSGVSQPARRSELQQVEPSYDPVRDKNRPSCRVWQWEASSVKAPSATPRRHPSFAAFMFLCRICHFIENFPKGKLGKSSCEYKGRSKCLTIGERDLSIIYEQPPNTLESVILGTMVSGYNCTNSCKKRWCFQEEVRCLPWRRACVPACILVFLSAALTKTCIFPSKFSLLFYCHRYFWKPKEQTHR